jgi:tricarballylate dehydrogenase
VTGNTLEELAKKLDGVDPQGFLRTIAEYNASIDQSVPFNPNIKDGRCANHQPVPKSNWANTIDQGPFEAYAVTCGVTFTFGGLRITTDAQVVDTEEEIMPGLYACGELVGGIFYGNYPGGSGLTNGSVFGRIAGANAAKYVSAAALVAN